MPAFALVDDGDNVLDVRSFDKKPADLPQKGWRWLPTKKQSPTYDPATEALVETGWLIADGTATRTYGKVPHTPEKTLAERLTALEARVSALDGK